MQNVISVFVLLYITAAAVEGNIGATGQADETTTANIPSDKILLSDVKVITLKSGLETTTRKGRAIPQLDYQGLNLYYEYRPSVVQCMNRGSDGLDIQWECSANMDDRVKFAYMDVNCEGYSYPHDPFILAGSCGLRYTLEANFDHKFSSTSILFFIVIGFFWAYLIYTTCSGVRDNAGFEHREARDHQHVNNDEVLQRVNQENQRNIQPQVAGGWGWYILGLVGWFILSVGTFGYISLSYLFQESPQGGILYSVFKNKQFRLPAEERLRKPRNKSKEIEVDTITEDEYKRLVTQLKEAPSYGTKEKEAMVQTFGKRRVCLSKKESIAAVIEEFPIFSTNPVEIDLEFRRIHPKAKFDDEKFRQHVEKFLDGKDTRDLIKKTLLDLSRRAKVDDLISDKDPVSVVAQKIVMTIFSGRVTVCLPGGTRLGSESIISGLILMLKCHYVFHEHYTKSVKCFYAVLEGLAGIPITVHAGAKSSRIVNEILD